jgi:hypothetical protein
MRFIFFVAPKSRSSHYGMSTSPQFCGAARRIAADDIKDAAERTAHMNRLRTRG